MTRRQLPQRCYLQIIPQHQSQLSHHKHQLQALPNDQLPHCDLQAIRYSPQHLMMVPSSTTNEEGSEGEHSTGSLTIDILVIVLSSLAAALIVGGIVGLIC